jgi:hypothetical protein
MIKDTEKTMSANLLKEHEECELQRGLLQEERMAQATGPSVTEMAAARTNINAAIAEWELRHITVVRMMKQETRRN